MSDDGEGVRKGLLYSSTATTAHSESSVELLLMIQKLWD